MKLKFIPLSIALVIIFCLSFFTASVLSAKNDDTFDLPEEEGVYDVPGHPKLKLRVFIHREARQFTPAKPTVAPPSDETNCDISNDDSSEALVDSTGWTLPDGDVTYYLNKTSVPSTISGDSFSALARNSFAAWHATEVSSQIPSFTEDPIGSLATRATLDNKYTIAWGRAPKGALAVNYTWASDGVIVDNDTILNTKYPWHWASDPTCAYRYYYDAQNILTHELGHMMGLLDEYEPTYTDHTMFGYGSTNETKKNTLTNGDISSVNNLY